MNIYERVLLKALDDCGIRFEDNRGKFHTLTRLAGIRSILKGAPTPSANWACPCCTHTYTLHGHGCALFCAECDELLETTHTFDGAAKQTCDAIRRQPEARGFICAMRDVAEAISPLHKIGRQREWMYYKDVAENLFGVLLRYEQCKYHDLFDFARILSDCKICKRYVSNRGERFQFICASCEKQVLGKN